jgi:hypothetical protein
MLKELIAELEKHDPQRKVPLGFASPHSYRGDYSDLAFEAEADTTVAAMLAAARSALGRTYEGWKGGEYTMSEWTDCWLAEHGHGDGETIGPVLLAMMLNISEEDATRANVKRFLPEWPMSARARR